MLNLHEIIQLIQEGVNIVQKDALVVEIGEGYLAFASYQPVQKKFSFINRELIGAPEFEKGFLSSFDSLDEKEFSSIIFVSAFAHAMLVPFQLNEPSVLFSHIYNDPSQTVMQDRIDEWQVCCMHSLPDSLHRVILEKFSSARFMHAFTMDLKTSGEAADMIMVDIQETTFRVLVKQNRMLKLAQVYHYASLLDIIYYLVKIINEFALDIASLPVFLSGKMSKEKEFEKELRDYFPGIAENKYNTPSGSGYQYSTFQKMAVCAL